MIKLGESSPTTLASFLPAPKTLILFVAVIVCNALINIKQRENNIMETQQTQLLFCLIFVWRGQCFKAKEKQTLLF